MMGFRLVSAHPGECRYPDHKAPNLTIMSRAKGTGLRLAIWVPAFAGMSGIKGALRLTSVALATVVLASPAFAAQPVDLRSEVVGHRGVVTLGDLFDGVEGSAAAKVLGRAPVGGEAVLDAGDVQLAARAAGLDWANSSGQRRIIVAVMDAPAETTRPSHAARRARHSRAAQTLVYARNISAGEMIEASDLEWSDEAIAGPDAPNRPEQAIGKAARLPLRAGAAVAAHELIAAKVIRRDQMISVDYEADGVSLSLAAKAMGDAAVGDTVQAVNLSSKKVIEAVATAPGHAAVGPGADAARFPGATLRTAANP